MNADTRRLATNARVVQDTRGLKRRPDGSKQLSQADPENKPADGRFSCSHYALSMP